MEKKIEERVWLSLRRDEEELSLDLAQISAFQRIHGGWKVYCGGAIFQVSEHEKHLIEEQIERQRGGTVCRTLREMEEEQG